jgi:hypothetical protein
MYPQGINTKWHEVFFVEKQNDEYMIKPSTILAINKQLPASQFSIFIILLTSTATKQTIFS